MHDPTQVNRQGPDVGDQYRSVVFTTTPEQLATAVASKERAQARFDKPIATQIEAAPTFYPAEGYHQRYYEGNGHTPYCHVLPVGVLKDLGLVPASS
jgi:peptide-methionine (S)-S-oxide reductase